ncbi:MAG: hypothetical protein HON42_03595 [Alphaproteobacteria bacterium]|nr:hypothetical protein [Alphaproteobacteria bacterium]MBT5827966.1 hypothetical protein [Alphaproteobacteria bacterium]
MRGEDYKIKNINLTLHVFNNRAELKLAISELLTRPNTAAEQNFTRKLTNTSNLLTLRAGPSVFNYMQQETIDSFVLGNRKFLSLFAGNNFNNSKSAEDLKILAKNTQNPQLKTAITKLCEIMAHTPSTEMEKYALASLLKLQTHSSVSLDRPPLEEKTEEQLTIKAEAEIKQQHATKLADAATKLQAIIRRKALRKKVTPIAKDLEETQEVIFEEEYYTDDEIFENMAMQIALSTLRDEKLNETELFEKITKAEHDVKQDGLSFIDIIKQDLLERSQKDFPESSKIQKWQNKTAKDPELDKSHKR